VSPTFSLITVIPCFFVREPPALMRTRAFDQLCGALVISRHSECRLISSAADMHGDGVDTACERRIRLRSDRLVNDAVAFAGANGPNCLAAASSQAGRYRVLTRSDRRVVG
jgi:hypothetical protein